MAPLSLPVWSVVRKLSSSCLLLKFVCSSERQRMFDQYLGRSPQESAPEKFLCCQTLLWHGCTGWHLVTMTRASSPECHGWTHHLEKQDAMLPVILCRHDAGGSADNQALWMGCLETAKSSLLKTGLFDCFHVAGLTRQYIWHTRSHKAACSS